MYSSYKQFVQKKKKLQTLALNKSLYLGGKDTIEEIHSLSSSVSKLVQLYTTAAARCTLITKGTAFPAFSGAIRDSLDKHLDRYLF